MNGVSTKRLLALLLSAIMLLGMLPTTALAITFEEGYGPVAATPTVAEGTAPQPEPEVGSGGHIDPAAEVQAFISAANALNARVEAILSRARALRAAQNAAAPQPGAASQADLDAADAAFQPDRDAIAAALEAYKALSDADKADVDVAAAYAALSELSAQVNELLDRSAPADYNTWFTVDNIKQAGITNQAFAQAVFESITNTTTGIGGGTMPAMNDQSLNPYDWPPLDAATSPADPPRITSYDELMDYINDPAAARTALEKTRMLLNWFSGKINASNKGITDINGISLLQNANTIDLSRNMIEDLTPMAVAKTDPPMFSGHVDIENNPIHRMPAWMGGTIHADTLGRGSKWVVVSDITTRFRFGDTSEATLLLDVQNTSGTDDVWEVDQSDPLIDDPNKQGVSSTVSIDTVDPNLRALTVMGKVSQEKNDGTGAIGLYKTAMVREPRGGVNSYIAGNIQYNSVIYSYQILTRLYSAVKNTANTEFLGGFKFKKVDAANATKVLPGAVYKLYDAAGNEVTTRYNVATNGTKTAIPITPADLTTNAVGEFTVKYLPAGNYTLVEQTASAGYKLDTTPIPVSVLTGANTPPTPLGSTQGGIASFDRTGSTVSTTPNWDEPGYFFDGIYYTNADLTAATAPYTAAGEGADLFMVNRTAGGWTGDATQYTLEYDDSLQADDYKTITRLKGELTTTGNYKQNSTVTITMENLKAATEGVANGTYPDLATAKAATNTVVTKASFVLARVQINQWANNNNITGDITVESNTVYTLNDAKFVSASQEDVAVRNLTVSKTVTSGSANKDFSFTVKLTDAANAALTGSYPYTGNGGAADGTLTLNAAGEATVTLKHGQSITITDIPQGSKYTVTEAAGGAGWSITAPAGGVASGTLTANSTAAFENAYTPAAAVLTVPNVTKTISGRQPLTPTTFTFTMAADDTTWPMPGGSTNGVKTVTSTGASVNAQFGNISFSEVGTYTYTITEKAESATGYTYDRTKYTYTVTVSDNNGALQATGALTSDAAGAANPVTAAAFDNAYNPTAHPYVVPAVTKSITGGHTPDTEQTFSYTLTQTAGVDTRMPSGSTGTTKTVDIVGANTAVFGDINYDGAAGNSYVYTIVENIPATTPPGHTYNPTNTSYRINVSITDVGGELTVTPVVTKVVNGVDQTDVDPATMFENAYEPTTITYDPAVTKTVTGAARPVGGDKTFDFALTRITADAPLPAGAVGNAASVQITGNGTANFGAIEYAKAGVYKYSITEQAPTTPDAGYTYDLTRYTLTVTVTDTAGVLSAAGEIVKFGTTTPTTASFTNTYAPTPATLLPPLSVTKTVDGNALPQAQEFTFTLALKSGSPAGVTMPTPTSVKTAEITTGSSAASLFNSVVFTAAGDYSFTVTETNSGIRGLAYAAQQAVYVKVTDNNGVLSAQYVDAAGVAVTDGDKLTFTNTYTPAAAEMPVSVTKTLAGNALSAAQDFTFTLALTAGDATNVTMAAPTTVTTAPITAGSAAPVSFGNIRFTAAGSYKFSVTESASGIAGMTDALPQEITIQVTDDDGVLRALYNNAPRSALTFTNVYTATGYTPQVTKVVNGGARPTEQTFSFVLTPKDAATPMPEGTAAGASKTITIEGSSTLTPGSFGTIVYTAAGTYEYTITEEQPAVLPAGYTYDRSAYTLTVRVSAAGTALTATAAIAKNGRPVTSAAFVNEYAPGSITQLVPNVRKSFNTTPPYQAPPTGQERTFAYVITAAPGETNPMPTNAVISSTAATMNAQFGTITFTAPGTYHYTISEQGVTYNGYQTDSTQYDYTVVVADQNGQLAVTSATMLKRGETTPVTEAAFENKYNPTGNPYTIPLVTKTVSGGHAVPAEETFSFLLTQTGGTPTVMPDGASGTTKTLSRTGAGTVDFGSLLYTAAGDYTYTITEVVPAVVKPGYTYNTTGVVYTITIKAEDINGTIHVRGTVKQSRNGGAAMTATNITFDNRYAPTPAELPLSVIKTITGDALPTARGFTFTLARTDNGPAANVTMPDPATVTTAAIKTGSSAPASFGNIIFNKAGTYTFSVTESASGINGMTDAAPQTVTVRVTDNNGVLSAAITDPAAGGALTFVNEFTRLYGTLTVRKTVSGSDAPANSLFTFRFTFSEPGTYAYTGSKTGTVSTGGSIQLKHNEIVTITIPQDVTYTVIEDAYSNFTPTPANRTYTGTISAAASEAAYTNTYNAPTPPTPVDPDPVHPNTPGYDPYIPVLTGGLQIQKAVTGDMGDKTAKFPFTVTLSAAGTYNYTGTQRGTIRSGDTVYLGDGDYINIYDLPAGTTYTVTESGNQGYMAYASNATGIVAANGATVAAFTNTRSSVPKTGDDNSLLLGVLLMGISALGMALMGIGVRCLRRKKRKA